MLLCDAAQVAEGKLHVLGAGWDVTGPRPVSSAIAVLIAVPWDRANSPIKAVLELLTQDGHPVTPGDAEQPIRIVVEFEVGRPPGLAKGVSLNFPLAVPIRPLELPPGQRFFWRLTIDDDSHEDWTLPFATRSMLPGPDQGQSPAG